MPILFSYGTLQHAEVQISTFGRVLVGHPDELGGFVRGEIDIQDPDFVETSGNARHAIVRHTGVSGDRVAGLALEVTDNDLTIADAYEPAGYSRIATILASGRQAWVYAGATDA